MSIYMTFEQWLNINEQELDCIFAESGSDREYDFDREEAEYTIYEAGPQRDSLEWAQPHLCIEQQLEQERTRILKVISDYEETNTL